LSHPGMGGMYHANAIAPSEIPIASPSRLPTANVADPAQVRSF
jgi:hypothetical protein